MMEVVGYQILAPSHLRRTMLTSAISSTCMNCPFQSAGPRQHVTAMILYRDVAPAEDHPVTAETIKQQSVADPAPDAEGHKVALPSEL